MGILKGRINYLFQCVYWLCFNPPFIQFFDSCWQSMTNSSAVSMLWPSMSTRVSMDSGNFRWILPKINNERNPFITVSILTYGQFSLAQVNLDAMSRRSNPGECDLRVFMVYKIGQYFWLDITKISYRIQSILVQNLVVFYIYIWLWGWRCLGLAFPNPFDPCRAVVAWPFSAVIPTWPCLAAYNSASPSSRRACKSPSREPGFRKGVSWDNENRVLSRNTFCWSFR